MSDQQLRPQYLPLPLADGKETFPGFPQPEANAVLPPGVFFVHDIHGRLVYSGPPEAARYFSLWQTPKDAGRMMLLRPLVLALLMDYATRDPNGIEASLEGLLRDALAQITEYKFKRSPR